MIIFENSVLALKYISDFPLTIEQIIFENKESDQIAICTLHNFPDDKKWITIPGYRMNSTNQKEELRLRAIEYRLKMIEGVIED
jgi:hypothetical protein